MRPARLDSSNASRGGWHKVHGRVVAMVLWALAGQAVAAGPPAVFRCTVNGQTVYQQGACDGGRGLALEPAPTAAARQAQDQDTARLQQAASALEADRLRRDGRASTARTRDSSGSNHKGKAPGKTAPLGTAPAPAPQAKPKKLPTSP